MRARHNRHGADRIVLPAAARPQDQLNVTPLIDILLVLLVIFMVTLPITQKGLDVDVPADVQTGLHESSPQIVVEVSATGQITLNKQSVALRDLRGRLRDVFRDRHDRTLCVIAAPTLRYRQIVAVVDAAKGAGIERVGIVTERMRKAG
jgi:biopolymer transport protein TolR